MADKTAEAMNDLSVADKPPSYEASLEEITKEFNGNVGYHTVSANQGAVYMARTDGVVDRSTGGGNVGYQIVSELENSGYNSAAAGHSISYLIRTDGCAVLTNRHGETHGVKSEVRPPPGMRYTLVTSGFYASYLLRSDGQFDRIVKSGKVDSTMAPAGYPGITYTHGSSGYYVSYLVRSDGSVDRVKSGKVELTMTPSSSKYIFVGDQISFEVSNGEYVTVESNHANYLIREDGIAIRTAKDGTVSKEYFPPAGTKYIHAAAGSGASYLILDNGVVERLGESWNMFCPSTKGKKISELVPPEGAKWKYIKASCGRDATYLLRSDGAVDRTSGGKIKHGDIFPRELGDIHKNNCVIM